MPILRRGINKALRGKSPLQVELASVSRASGVKGFVRSVVALNKQRTSSIRNQDRVLEASQKGLLGAKKNALAPVKK
ncbi:MAG: hypothetical protein WCW44_03155 [archaeon]|jgi:hypothetical protein